MKKIVKKKSLTDEILFFVICDQDKIIERLIHAMEPLTDK